MIFFQEKDRKRKKREEAQASEEVLETDVPYTERRFSTDGELEKSTDDDLSADLMQLMVPVATER